MGNEMTVEAILKAKGWSIQKMADKFGVDHSTVWKWKKFGVPTKGTSKTMLEMEWKKIQRKAAALQATSENQYIDFGKSWE